jgi:hypothetical protein
MLAFRDDAGVGAGDVWVGARVAWPYQQIGTLGKLPQNQQYF